MTKFGELPNWGHLGEFGFNVCRGWDGELRYLGEYSFSVPDVSTLSMFFRS